MTTRASTARRGTLGAWFAGASSFCSRWFSARRRPSASRWRVRAGAGRRRLRRVVSTLLTRIHRVRTGLIRIKIKVQHVSMRISGKLTRPTSTPLQDISKRCNPWRGESRLAIRTSFLKNIRSVKSSPGAACCGCGRVDGNSMRGRISPDRRGKRLRSATAGRCSVFPRATMKSVLFPLPVSFASFPFERIFVSATTVVPPPARIECWIRRARFSGPVSSRTRCSSARRGCSA